MPPDESTSSSITPRQAVQLLEDVRETRDTVVKIKSLCEPCRKQVDRLTTVIDGDGGDGLKSRVLLVEQVQKTSGEITESLLSLVEQQAKWSRVKIGAILTALLSFIGMAAAYFFGG